MAKVKETIHWLIKSHNALFPENGLWHIIAFPLHQQSWTSHTDPMSWGCNLLISGSKGQRSRSQAINSWKLLMTHICVPFTPSISELHTKTPHMSRMCTIDSTSKDKRSKSRCIYFWKWFIAKSRKYQGVFEMKSRVKTWQVRGIRSQQFEHKQVPKWGTEPGVRKGKRIIASPLHLQSSHSTHRLPMS